MSNKAFLYIVLMVLLVLTLISSMGCGYIEASRNHCRLGDQTCDNLLGKDTDNRLTDLETRVSANEKEIASLKTMVNGLIDSVNSLTSQALSFTSTILLLQQSTADHSEIIGQLSTEIVSLGDRVDYQQVIINGMIADIANLQASDATTEFLLPCGDRVGVHDEAILRLQSGKLVAYFEDGGSRFLTVLEPGTYRTTDRNPKCNFTVDANLNIINASR